MPAHSFGAFIQHESETAPTSLAKTVHRDTITPAPPSVIELDQIQWGKPLQGPVNEDEVAVHSVSRDLEASQPSTPKGSKAVDALLQSVTNPPRNKWRVASATVMFMLMGMNDAAVSIYPAGAMAS